MGQEFLLIQSDWITLFDGAAVPSRSSYPIDSFAIEHWDAMGAKVADCHGLYHSLFPALNIAPIARPSPEDRVTPSFDGGSGHISFGGVSEIPSLRHRSN